MDHLGKKPNSRLRGDHRWRQCCEYRPEQPSLFVYIGGPMDIGGQFVIVSFVLEVYNAGEPLHELEAMLTS